MSFDDENEDGDGDGVENLEDVVDVVVGGGDAEEDALVVEAAVDVGIAAERDLATACLKKSSNSVLTPPPPPVATADDDDGGGAELSRE